MGFLTDTDYSLRAKKAGFENVVVGDALFDSNENESLEDQSLLLSSEPWKKIWLAKFHSMKSSMYFPSYTRLSFRHWGVVGLLMVVGMLLKHVVYLLLQLFVLRKYLLYWFGSRLRTWRESPKEGGGQRAED